MYQGIQNVQQTKVNLLLHMSNQDCQCPTLDRDQIFKPVFHVSGNTKCTTNKSEFIITHVKPGLPVPHFRS